MKTPAKIALWDVPPLYRRRPDQPTWPTTVVWQVVPASERRYRVVPAAPGWTEVV
ncbi:MAG: hypothetical protein H7841_11525 [Magnetospirillum sp. WYHS-4]